MSNPEYYIRWDIRLKPDGTYSLGFFTDENINTRCFANNWTPPRWVTDKIAMIDLLENDLCVEELVGMYRAQILSGSTDIWYTRRERKL